MIIFFSVSNSANTCSCYSNSNIIECDNIDNFLKNTICPKLDDNEKNSIENPITENELKKALSEFKNNKSPGTDGLVIEFYKKNVGRN